VAANADVGIGNVRMFGRDNGGIDVDFEDNPDAAADVTRLVLDADVGLGEVRVTDPEGEFDFRDRSFGRFDEEEFDGPDFEPTRDANAVCEGTAESANG
jgi:hypothetical protein